MTAFTNDETAERVMRAYRMSAGRVAMVCDVTRGG